MTSEAIREEPQSTPEVTDASRAPQRNRRGQTKQRRHHHNGRDWETRQAQLTEMYVEEGKRLTDIIALMKSDGFHARCVTALSAQLRQEGSRLPAAQKTLY